MRINAAGGPPPTVERMKKPAIAAVAAALLLSACAELLPKAHSEVDSPWTTFEQARETVERIVPGRTTSAELRTMGLDPYTSSNVQLLSFSDVLLRFPHAGTLKHIDDGLRRCLDSGQACTGLAITARSTRRERVGGFWADALSFKRVVDVTGWSFNALVLVVDERAVYTLYGGQPLLREQDINRQPLGPLQDWGGALPVGKLFK
jgi:hypothetical protein